MYMEFLEVLLIYIKHLNAADVEVEALGFAGTLYPYLDVIPVMMDSTRVGRLVDEIGGAWSYVEEPPA